LTIEPATVELSFSDGLKVASVCLQLKLFWW